MVFFYFIENTLRQRFQKFANVFKGNGLYFTIRQKVANVVSNGLWVGKNVINGLVTYNLWDILSVVTFFHLYNLFCFWLFIVHGNQTRHVLVGIVELINMVRQLNRARKWEPCILYVHTKTAYICYFYPWVLFVSMSFKRTFSRKIPTAFFAR